MFLDIGLPVFYVHEPILFDVSLSTDRGGTITRFEWDFRDEKTVVEKPIVYHTYGNVSLQTTATLVVWDDDNLSSIPYTERFVVGLILTPIDVGMYLIFLVAVIVLIVAVMVVRRILRRRQR